MDVLCAEVELHLPECRSLKQKRGLIKGIKQRIRDRFGVSVAEIAYQDKWQRAVLGIALVSSDIKIGESLFQKLKNHLDSDPRVWVIDIQEEWR